MPMNLGYSASTGALQQALEAAGVPYVGPPGSVVDLVSEKFR